MRPRRVKLEFFYDRGGFSHASLLELGRGARGAHLLFLMKYASIAKNREGEEEMRKSNGEESLFKQIEVRHLRKWSKILNKR